MSVKRVRHIYTAKGDYTADGLRGRLLADELLETFKLTMKAAGFSEKDTRYLLDDARYNPADTYEQVKAAKDAD